MAPGKRTVTSVLRAVGLSQETKFHKYHRVLSLARWCALQGARILLSQLLSCFLAEGPVAVGIDETLERRWGGKGVGAAFSDGAGPQRALRHRSGQAAQGSHRLGPPDAATPQALPGRQAIAVGDGSYAVIELPAALGGHVTFIAGLRLDAALYAPAPAREPGKPGRSRKKGQRLPFLREVSEGAATRWQRVKLTDWHGHGQKETATAVWYHSGKPALPLRWVLLLRPGGEDGGGGLLCQKVVGGGHAAGDKSAAGGGDAEAVAGQSHRARHTGAAGAFLAHRPAG